VGNFFIDGFLMALVEWLKSVDMLIVNKSNKYKTKEAVKFLEMTSLKPKSRQWKKELYTKRAAGYSL
jgi:hypothetical protein